MVSVYSLLFYIFGITFYSFPGRILANPILDALSSDFRGLQLRGRMQPPPVIAKRQVTTCKLRAPRLVGCYDRKDRALFPDVSRNDDRTELECNNSCFEKGHSFAAVDGVWCLCGSVFAELPLAKLDESECDTECPGPPIRPDRPKFKCGGNGRTRIWFCSTEQFLPAIEIDDGKPSTITAVAPKTSNTAQRSAAGPPNNSLRTSAQATSTAKLSSAMPVISRSPSASLERDPEFPVTTPPDNTTTRQSEPGIRTITITNIVTASSQTSSSTSKSGVTTVTITEQNTVTYIRATTSVQTTVRKLTTTVVSVVTSTPPSDAAPRGSFNCPSYGFITNETGIFTFDMTTKQVTNISKSSKLASPDALGYNVLDHSLYFIEQSSSAVMKMTADGVTTKIFSWPGFEKADLGDIDTSGQYWIATGFDQSNMSNWTQIDLNPYSSKYGNIVNAGVVSRPGNGAGDAGKIADWTYIPSAGRYLWSFGVTDFNSNALALYKFDMTNPGWSLERSYGTNIQSNVNSCFGSDNGYLYCTIQNGDWYETNVLLTSASAEFFPNAGIPWATNGARCVLNRTDI